LISATVAAEVLTFTPFWRDAAAEVGLRRPTSVSDLALLAPRSLSALGAPSSLVLRPSPAAVAKNGPRPLRRRLRRARLRRNREVSRRRILDPLYKPIHWIIEGDVPVGCTEADLVRLAELGRRSLELAGVGGDDAIVGLVPPGPTLASWQLVLGAREAGVPLAALAPSASIEAVSLLGPTVLAGRPADLRRVLGGLSGSARNGVRTVLAITRAPLLPDERAALEGAAGSQSVVVESWAPPGTRALWTQCRGGDGVHTWPQAELLEVCGPDGTAAAPGAEGELVWTGLGWRGTALVRLATGVKGRLVDGRCEACGRTTPRILDARPIGRAAANVGDGAGVGALKATGGYESVRTVRVSRPEATRLPSLPAPESPASVDDGAVRAVPKDLPEKAAAAPPEADPLVRGEAVDLGHLPPVPEVGPDAAREPADDAWLPETGEVDAWPAPVLASTDGLAVWQVEHRRRRGRDELVVHLALADGTELADVLMALERAVGATQYVVDDEATVAARVAAADGRRVVDRRSGANGNGGSRRSSAAGSPGGR